MGRDKITIFLYGEFISEDFLEKYFPGRENLFKVITQGFVRVLNVESDMFYDSTSGYPISVFNIEKSEGAFPVNGISIDVPIEEFERYSNDVSNPEILHLTVKDFGTQERKWSAYSIRKAHFEPYEYLENSDKQKEYINTCLESFKSYGKDFLEFFKDSTYIDNNTLRKNEDLM